MSMKLMMSLVHSSKGGAVEWKSFVPPAKITICNKCRHGVLLGIDKLIVPHQHSKVEFADAGRFLFDVTDKPQ